MPAITTTTDLTAFPAWQTGGHNLVAGAGVVTAPVASVAPGLPLGAVLGVVTATGAYVLCDPLVNPPDGSQTPVAVLASQASAGPPPVQATVYTAGPLATKALFYLSNWTVGALAAALNQAGIFLRNPSIGPLR